MASGAAIVGVAESDLGVVAPKTVLQLQAQAAKAALEDAGDHADRHRDHLREHTLGDREFGQHPADRIGESGD